jgi:NAD(P)-dependent dehydrogenase (short-subunit alcohol dehydrogenase family)
LGDAGKLADRENEVRMTPTDGAVLVMGAAGAIGQEVCRELIARGAAVLAFDRRSQVIEFRGREQRVHELKVTECDASDLSAVTDAVDDALDTHGHISGLVNIAGWFDIVDFTDTDATHWDAMLRANLLTAMASCRAVVPHMAARHDGSIVNFASTAGEYGSIRPSAAYAAAKGGVIAFSKSLAREVSPLGVRVNVISPGPVHTEMLHASTPAALEATAARTLLGRLGTPHDIAAGVAYLLSPDAAWVTGEVLRVNGGSLI